MNLPSRTLQEQGICWQCKQLAIAKCYSDAGKREFQISGLCEECFDSLFAEDDLEEISEDDIAFKKGNIYEINNSINNLR